MAAYTGAKEVCVAVQAVLSCLKEEDDKEEEEEEEEPETPECELLPVLEDAYLLVQRANRGAEVVRILLDKLKGIGGLS